MLMPGNIIKMKLMSFAFQKTPNISLSCKLELPVWYQEYKNGLNNIVCVLVLRNSNGSIMVKIAIYAQLCE